MSDVLLYAAMKENQRLRDAYRDSKIAAAGGANVYTADNGALGSADIITGISCAAPSAGGSGTNSTARLKAEWAEVFGTLAAPKPNGIKVCDTSGYYRCGYCCGFTVPSGVSRITIQSWAPGGGTGSNCCCGGAPFGPSGAYTIVEFDVSQSESLVLCAGCAYCCFAYQTTNGYCGGNTWFCMANGPYVCTMSGLACFTDWMNATRSHSDNAYAGNSNNSAEIPSGSESNLCGAYQCSGWNFCWDSSNDQLEIDYVYSDIRTWNVYCMPQSRNPICFGVPSMYPYMKIASSLNQGNQSRSCPAPVPGYEDCTCVFCWNGNSCFGCNYTGCNHRQIPGSGGAANSVFSGCQACGGDSGRMGMICVSWCCC
tara:strand:+ start:2348 stop:3454 length:1107 start_codon:yes stop_codon:yes gene_type:complete